MTWWAAGITAAMGVKKGMDNEHRMSENDKFRKAAITYAPWTGMGDPGSPQLPGAMESGVQGGLTGAMVGSAIGKTGGADKIGAADGAPLAGGAGDAPTIPQGGGEQLNFDVAGKPKTMMASGGQMGQGPYSQMGSAGALGGGQNPNDPNNPLFNKYSAMGRQA